MLAAFVAIGVVLRGVAVVAYRPAVMVNNDSLVYLAASGRGLFDDPVRPAGYPLFLRVARQLSDALEVTIVAQHLLGVLAALLLYLSVRRLGGPRWAGIVPAAVVLLGADQLWLEHALLSEPLFTFMLALAVYLATWSAGPAAVASRSRWVLLAATGACVGAMVPVRYAAAPLIAVFALWAAWASRGRLMSRLAGGAVVGAGGAAVVVAYMLVQAHFIGEFTLSRSSGWSIYARTAPFADCRQFDPPAGTEALCEQTPPSQRPGPRFYHWDAGSPAVRVFGFPPGGNDRLAAFGRRAALAQPGAFAEAALADMVRYVVPSANVRAGAGDGPEALDFARRSPTAERYTIQWVDELYDDRRLAVTGGVRFLDGYQQVARMHGLLLAALVLIAVGGLIVGRRAGREAIALLLGVALCVYLVPAITLLYNARYGVPAEGLVAAAAAVAAHQLRTAVRRRSR